VTAAGLISSASARDDWISWLSRSNEVPLPKGHPPWGSGVAGLGLGADGKSLNYGVSLTAVNNVTAVDIHNGKAAQNGLIVAILSPVNGQFKQEYNGTITAADLKGLVNRYPT